VPVRWVVAGTEHTGTVKAHPTAKIEDLIEIWVDNDGSQVHRPTSTTRGAEEAVMAASAIWVSVAAAAALFAGPKLLMPGA
jgi:hypothetical protein